jgi:poly(A) polymerase
MHFPKWLNINLVQRIFQLLSSEGECRLVGGCVRNILSEGGATDIDIATTLTPERMMLLAQSGGIKCVPTGVKHGTVTYILDGINFEITTLRKDVATDGRHAEVEFTNKWEEDAKRRDFTVNAMYMDVEGKVYDYFNGEKDLKAQIIRFVGDPETRINEDYLRILRYFRFLGYFSPSIKPNEDSFNAVCKLAKNIKFLSGERVQSELFKITSGRYFNHVAKLMHQAKIWQIIGLDFGQNELSKLLFDNSPLVNLALLMRLAALDLEKFKVISNRLKFSKKHKSYIQDLLFETPRNISQANDLATLYRFGRDKALDMCNLLKGENIVVEDSVKENISEFQIPVFPIQSADLIKLGFVGADLGKKLKSLEYKWLESNCTLTNVQLLNELIVCD